MTDALAFWATLGGLVPWWTPLVVISLTLAIVAALVGISIGRQPVPTGRHRAVTRADWTLTSPPARCSL